jgi:hypothetical protein
LIACSALLSGVAQWPSAARAESGLQLLYPSTFGSIPASTYDEHRRLLGTAKLSIEKREGGDVRIISESGFDGGARTLASADLQRTEDGHLLLLRQSSRSFDTEGSVLGDMAIDHVAGTATCAPPPGSPQPVQTLALPRQDRVVNVPLNLFFLPLVRKEIDSLSFQLMLCRGGPKLMDFTASVANGNGHANGSSHLVEVRYRPDMSPMMSFFAQAMIPKLSFWFDPRAKDPWMAHRIPLFSSGPEVFVVREGVSLDRLSGAN